MGRTIGQLDGLADLSGGIDLLLDDLDRGINGFLAVYCGGGLTGYAGSHLQVEVAAHFVGEHCSGSSLSDLTADCVKCLSQCAFGFSIYILIGRRSNTLQNIQCSSLLDSTIVTNMECQGVHGSAQTGQLVHILVLAVIVLGVICSQSNQFAGNGVHTGAICALVLTDNDIIFVGITLDRICHPVVVVGTVKVVAMGGTIVDNIVDTLIGIMGTGEVGSILAEVAGQPVVPFVRTGTAAGGVEEVILVGSTVRHEQNEQRTLILAIFFLDGIT